QCLRDVRVQVPSPAPFGEEGFALQLSRRTVLAGLASLGLTPFITPASAASSETTDTTDIFRIGVPARAITTDPSVTSDIQCLRDVRVQVPSPAPFGEEGFALQLSRRTVLAGLASLGLTPFITPASAASSETTDTTDIFRIGVPARAITTDPSVTSDIESHRLSRQIYQNLIGVDPETGETIAELATDWTLRDDGLKLDLQLQQDVTFHDGTKLTA